MSSFQCQSVDDYIDILWRSTTHGGVKPKTPKESNTPLFALIVAINTYALEKLNLRGAIADGDAMQDYLENELSVPKSRIQNLRDSQATRAAIIAELESLAHNDLIQPDDPILIYYAGHGAEATAPDGWAAGGSDNKIQMLIPYDYGIASPGGSHIQGIPDRTIGILLNRLAKAKGDNVTVIFDCCHSGSGTRLDLFARGVRGFTISDPIPADLDVDIWSTFDQVVEDRGGRIPHFFVHSGLRSHVLLAACGAKEQAREEYGRGVFTRALLQLLTAINIDTITYSDILRRVHALPEQNPQCEGVNKNRILFQGKVPSRGRLFYKVRKDKDNARYYILEAGAAHGIRKDAVFDVYPTEPNSQHTLPHHPHAPASMIARETRAFTSILKLDNPNPSFTLLDVGYAVQTRAGEEEDLRLHIDLDSIPAFTPILRSLGHDMSSNSFFGSTLRRISLLPREKAEYEICLKDNRVFLTVLNPEVNQFGLYQLPENVELAYPHVTRLLSALAHYQKHLRRKYNNQALERLIEIKFTRLETRDESDDSLDSPGETPVGENLNKGGTVHIPINPSQSGNALYGIEIINHSPLNLYASVFYFDNSNLSIESYYESSPPDICLSKKSTGNGMPGSLTLGYGSSGSQPYEYYLDEDQQVDVGFLKVYLTTTPVDFSHVAQESPFNSESEEDTDGGSRAGGVKAFDHSGPDLWTTILVTMVQKRSPLNGALNLNV